jgi:tryptophan 2,3-dioxygenase
MHGLYYGDYLQLGKILTAQELESAKHNDPAHDEMLFIIVHQAFELWFKQMLFEIDDVCTILSKDYTPESEVSRALSRIQRVNRILEMLPDQFSILETMTPSDFMEFRDYLYPASGFQSMQFRVMEIRCGVDEKKRLQIDSHGYASRLNEPDRQTVLHALAQPSLFDVVQKWLEKIPFMEHGEFAFWTAYRDAVQTIFSHDRNELELVDTLTNEEREKQLKQIETLETSFSALFDEGVYSALVEQGERRLSQKASLSALFITVYSHYPLLQTPFRLLNALLEMDKLISVFRFRHTMMVSRMIGQRVGTGGSAGFDYLMKTVTQHRIFNDISSLSSYLLASHAIPTLPEGIARKLQFVAEAE